MDTLRLRSVGLPLVAALVVGAVVGFAICESPGWVFIGSSMTFEPFAIGLGALLAIIGVPLLLLRHRTGMLLVAAAIGIVPGGITGIAARPGPPQAVRGEVRITIDAPATVFVAKATCNVDAIGGDAVSLSDGQAGSIDGRAILVIGYLTGGSFELSLMQGAIPDSSPRVESNEYHWQARPRGSAVPGGITLADMPMPTPVPIPSAPPMTISGVTIAPHLLSGSFRFSGMQALSADRPFSGGGWPLVLNGTVDWTCGP
jgi:hypothetical protein